MNRFLLKFTASALALALGSAPAWTGAAAQVSPTALPGQSYVLIDLTPAGSATSSVAGAAGGQQVGSAGLAAAADQPVVSHALLWNGSAAGALDLGTGTAAAVGDGQQVGSANDHAALWLGTAASRIDLNPAQWDQSVSTGVAGGQQVGWATRSVPCTTKKGSCSNGERTEFHPFLWSGSAASAVDLTPLGLGFGAGRALGTDGVQQVGIGFEAIGINAFSGPFAVLWSGTAESAVNLNPFDAATSQANAVAGGQQVGYGYTPKRALLWRGSAESMVDMHPDGYTSSEANATNGFKQVGSGYIFDPVTLVGHSHALVWSGNAASAVDLNQYLPDGFTDAAATGIDAEGRIVGWAGRGSSDPANVHAVMWVPFASEEAFASTVSPARPSIAVGEAVMVTVELSRPAPQGGATVNLSHAILSQTAGTAAPPLTVGMPPSLIVPEGESAASFDVVTEVTTLDGFTRPYLIDIRATYGGATPNATLSVEPPLFLSSLSVAPGSVAGGATATATIALNGAAPAGGALVALTSDSPAAVVPSSVLIPAGQTGATFGVKTNAVTTATTATLTATYGSTITATGTAKLVVNPPAAQASDTVAIQRVEYVAAKRQLSVQATSTNAAATLTVSVAATGQVIGVLANRGDGRYDGTFSVATNPQTIVVRSSLGGSASRAVTLK
jgi:hypothetical protein